MAKMIQSRDKNIIDINRLPSLMSDKALLFFEIGWNQIKSYEKSHLNGAGYLDTGFFEGGKFWNILPLEEMLSNLLSCYNPVTIEQILCDTVILYGSDQSAVCRVAVILMHIGCSDVRIINGSKENIHKAWPELFNSQPYIYSTDSLSAHSTMDHIYLTDLFDTSQKRKILLDYDDLLRLDQNTFQLISIRSLEEYRGLTSGYSYFNAKGRIPGSIHGHDITHYRNSDGTMASPDHITNTLGLTSNTKTKIFYCGTSWRASEVLFYTYVLGYDHCLYDGGWFEWSEETR